MVNLTMITSAIEASQRLAEKLSQVANRLILGSSCSGILFFA